MDLQMNSESWMMSHGTLKFRVTAGLSANFSCHEFRKWPQSVWK